jgi:hypothetical protein
VKPPRAEEIVQPVVDRLIIRIVIQNVEQLTLGLPELFDLHLGQRRLISQLLEGCHLTVLLIQFGRELQADCRVEVGLAPAVGPAE